MNWMFWLRAVVAAALVAALAAAVRRICILVIPRKHTQAKRTSATTPPEFTEKDRALIELISDLVDVLDIAEKEALGKH